MAADPRREAIVVRADELRKALRRKGLQHEEKRDLIAAVKRETYELLQELHVPHPLCGLIADLWGGYPAFWRSQNPAPLIAARIEGEHAPGELGRNELDRLLRAELESRKAANRLDPDYRIARCYRRQITNWRREPVYQRIVRQTRGE